MRPAALAITAALLLAGIAGQNALLRSTEAIDSSPAITGCPDAIGATVQGACSPVSLDSNPGSILSYTVLANACPGADLHLVEYVPAGGVRTDPLVARWCA
jgi:hypothetical protein